MSPPGHVSWSLRKCSRSQSRLCIQVPLWEILDKVSNFIDNLNDINPYPALPKKWLAFATSIEPGQTAHIAVWSGFILLADQLLYLILISQRIIMDSSKNERWTSPFKKFSRLRVMSGYSQSEVFMGTNFTDLLMFLCIHRTHPKFNNAN